MSLLTELTKAERKPESGWGMYSAIDSPDDDDDVSLVDDSGGHSRCNSSDSSLTGSPKCRSDEDKNPSDFKSSETPFRIPKKVGDKQLSFLGFENSFCSKQNGNPSTQSVETRRCLRSGTHSPDSIASRLNRQRNVGRPAKGSCNLSNKNRSRTRSSPLSSKLAELINNEMPKNKGSCTNRSPCRWRYANPPSIEKKLKNSTFQDGDIFEVHNEDETPDVQEIKANEPLPVGKRTRSCYFKDTSKPYSVFSITDKVVNTSVQNKSSNLIHVQNGHCEDEQSCDDDILTSIDLSSITLPMEENKDSESGSDHEDAVSERKCSRCLQNHQPGQCQRIKMSYSDRLRYSATPREALHKDSNKITANSFYSNKNAPIVKTYEKTVMQCLKNSSQQDIEWKEMPCPKNKNNSTMKPRVSRKNMSRMANKRKKPANKSDTDTETGTELQPNQKRKTKSQKVIPKKIQAVVITSSDEEEEKSAATDSRVSVLETLTESDETCSTSEEKLPRRTTSQVKLREEEDTESNSTGKSSNKIRRDQEQENESVNGFQRDNIDLDIMLGKTVRIGKIVGFPTAPLEVSSSGISLFVSIDNKEVSLSIKDDELESLQINPTEEPRIIALTVNQKCALRIKSRTHIKTRDFNPGSMVQAERGIVLEVAEEISSETQADLMDWVKEKLSKIYCKISPDRAKKILDMTSVPEGQVPDDQATEKHRYRTRLRNSQKITNSFHEPVKNLITYPEPPIQGGITVTSKDTECLNPGEFMNDVLIDFYLKYIYHEKLSEADRQRTHIFSSYFYKRLTQKHRHVDQDEVTLSSPDRMHKQVHKWTRNVDIFEKDFIIVPVNQSLHWFLAIICFPSQKEAATIGTVELEDEEIEESQIEKENKKIKTDDDLQVDTKTESKVDDLDCKERKSEAGTKGKVVRTQPSIIIFDSLGGSGRAQVFHNLRNYLSVEWRERKQNQHGSRVFTAETIKGRYAKVPLQDNFCDCGVFLLQYVESFFEDPIIDYQETPVRKVNWFPLQKIAQKRLDILNLILELNERHEEQD